MTIPVDVISISAVASIPDDTREAATNLFVKGVPTGAEDDPQITVVLNGVIYDAVVLRSALTEEVEAAQAVLPDGDYTVTADVPDLAGSCLLAFLPNGLLSLSPDAAHNPPQLAGDQYNDGSLAETGIPWVAHSTRESSSTRAKITIRKSIGRLVIPSNIVLTQRVLVSALVKLPTHQIEEAVEVLMANLDFRGGDPDLEFDADFEEEVDEQSVQVVR